MRANNCAAHVVLAGYTCVWVSTVALQHFLGADWVRLTARQLAIEDCFHIFTLLWVVVLSWLPSPVLARPISGQTLKTLNRNGVELTGATWSRFLVFVINFGFLVGLSIMMPTFMTLSTKEVSPSIAACSHALLMLVIFSVMSLPFLQKLYLLHLAIEQQ